PRHPRHSTPLPYTTLSRSHRHEENAAKLVTAALEQPIHIGAALLASAEGYTPRSTQLIDGARERLGTIAEVAAALAENLPAPKADRKSTRLNSSHGSSSYA